MSDQISRRLPGIKVVVIILPFIVINLNACEDLIFYNQGDEINQLETFESFSMISVFDIFDIELSSDSLFSYSLESYEKYMDQILVTLDTGNLVLKDNNNVKWLPDYPRPKIKITMPGLDEHILLESPVYLYSEDTLHIPKLNIVSLGKTGDIDLLLDVHTFRLSTGSDNSGIYKIRGSADQINLWPRGSSIFDASGLTALNCYIYNNSIGDSKVRVLDKLEAKLNTLGNVLYYGNPKEVILLEESGEGRLINAE